MQHFAPPAHTTNTSGGSLAAFEPSGTLLGGSDPPPIQYGLSTGGAAFRIPRRFSLVVSLAPLALSFARPPCHAHGRHRTERGCAQPYHRITLSPYHRVAALRCSVTTSTSEYYSTHHSDSMARYSARTYSILAGRPVHDWLAQHERERDMDVDVNAYTADGVGVEMARGLQPNENRRTGEREEQENGKSTIGQRAQS